MRKLLAVFMAVMFISGGVHAATYTWTGTAADGLFDTTGNWSGSAMPFSDNRNGVTNAMTNADADTIDINANNVIDRALGYGTSDFGSTAGQTVNATNNTVLLFEYTRIGWDGEDSTFNLVDGSELDAGTGLSLGNAGGVGTLNVTDSDVTVHWYSEAWEGRIYIGYSADASMTVNGTSEVAAQSDNLVMSYFEDVDSTLTINDGLVDGAWGVKMGGDAGLDSGTSRIYLNGGMLKANSLEFNMLDAKVVLDGGVLALHSSNVSTNDLVCFVYSGRIEAGAGKGFNVGETNLSGTVYSYIEAVVGGTTYDPVTYTWTGLGDGTTIEDDSNWSGTNPFSDFRNGDNTVLNMDAGETVDIDASGGTITRTAGWSSNFASPAGATVNVNDTVLDLDYTRVGYIGEDGELNLTGGSDLEAGGGLSIGNGSGGSGVLNVTDSSVSPNSGARIYIGYDADGSMTVNGSSSDVTIVSKDLYLSYNENVDSTLTINDGLVDGSWGIYLGGNQNSDTGTSRIYLNGGMLKANNLSFNMLDAKVVLDGGVLALHSGNVSTNDLVYFVYSGRIEAGAGKGFNVGETNLSGTVYSYIEAVVGGTTYDPATYTWTGLGDGTTIEDNSNWSGTNPFSDFRNGDNTVLNMDAGETVDIDAGGGTITRTAGWSSNFASPAGATVNVNDTVLDLDYTRVGYIGEDGELNLTGGSDLQAGGGLSIGNGSGGSGVLNVTDSSVTPNSSGRIYIGYDADGSMTVDGSSSDVTVTSQNLVLSYTESVDSTLTINDGLVDGSWGILMGGNTGTDSGTSRININGGELTANNLLFNMADAKVVMTGGKLSLYGTNVSTNQLQTWVDAGTIDVTGASGYSITIEGSYSVLEVAAAHEASTIVSISHDSGNVYELVVDCPTPSTSYPKTRTDLLTGSWADIAHSTSSGGPFAIDSLGVVGTNTIYVQSSSANAFFGIGE